MTVKKREKSAIKVESNAESINKSQDLLASIRRYDEYFSSLIDLIPPKIYFEGNDEILDAMEAHKQSKFSDDSKLSIRAKHKRVKLDPNMNRSVSQIASQFYANNDSQTLSSVTKKRKRETSVDSKMAELRKKLSERLTELKGSRGGDDGHKKRPTRRERRRLNSNLKQKRPKAVDDAVDESETNLSPNASRVKAKLESETKLPKIYNKEGNLVFSKFDFISTPTQDENKKHKKKDSLKKKLFKARKEEEKMSNMEETNAEMAKQVKQKRLWRTAINKSEGIKERNNPQMIEKTLKKRRKMKMKSKKEWKERSDSVDAKVKAKQDKRNKNIDARKRQKREHKLKILQKRGRIIPNKKSKFV